VLTGRYRAVAWIVPDLPEKIPLVGRKCAVPQEPVNCVSIVPPVPEHHSPILALGIRNPVHSPTLSWAQTGRIVLINLSGPLPHCTLTAHGGPIRFRWPSCNRWPSVSLFGSCTPERPRANHATPSGHSLACSSVNSGTGTAVLVPRGKLGPQLEERAKVASNVRRLGTCSLRCVLLLFRCLTQRGCQRSLREACA
jgi:hypothetical protein